MLLLITIAVTAVGCVVVIACAALACGPSTATPYPTSLYDRACYAPVT